MSNISRVAAMLFAICFLGSCGTVKMGRDFEVRDFASKIEQGVTTQNMVRSWLGEPTSTGESLATDGERFDEWAYYFAEGELSDMSTAKVKILQSSLTRRAKCEAITGLHPGNQCHVTSPDLRMKNG